LLNLNRFLFKGSKLNILAYNRFLNSIGSFYVGVSYISNINIKMHDLIIYSKLKSGKLFSLPGEDAHSNTIQTSYSPEYITPTHKK
jgi:hypothetical protein